MHAVATENAVRLTRVYAFVDGLGMIALKVKLMC